MVIEKCSDKKIVHPLRYYTPNVFLDKINFNQLNSDSPIEVSEELDGISFYRFFEERLLKTYIEFSKIYGLSQQRLFPFPKNVHIGYLILEKKTKKIHNDYLDFESLSLLLNFEIAFEERVVHSGTDVYLEGFSHKFDSNDEFYSHRENNFHGFGKYFGSMFDGTLKSSRFNPIKRTLEHVANENFKVDELLPDSWFLRDVK